MFTMKYAEGNTFEAVIKGKKTKIFREIWLEKVEYIDGYNVDAIRIMSIDGNSAEIILLQTVDTVGSFVADARPREEKLLKLKRLEKAIAIYHGVVKIPLNGKLVNIGKIMEE